MRGRQCFSAAGLALSLGRLASLSLRAAREAHTLLKCYNRAMGSRVLALALLLLTAPLLFPRGAGAVQAPAFTSENAEGKTYALPQLLEGHAATVLTFW